jgi:hypothetical protein
MKSIVNLPLNIVKVILSIAALPIGVLVIIAGLIAYTDYKALFGKKKSSATEA